MDSNPELHGFMARAASRRASSTQPCFRAALSLCEHMHQWSHDDLTYSTPLLMWISPHSEDDEITPSELD